MVTKLSGPVMSNDDDSQAEMQAQCDMRTLAEAYKINKDPKRKAAAQAMARKKADELTAVAGAK